MDLQLKGKCALVTGSTGGIGEQIAKTLATEGALVIVHGRRETEAHRVQQEIATSGSEAAFVIGDLGSDKQATEIAKKATETFGQVDILINNAGAFPAKTISAIDSCGMERPLQPECRIGGAFGHPPRSCNGRTQVGPRDHARQLLRRHAWTSGGELWHHKVGAHWPSRRSCKGIGRNRCYSQYSQPGSDTDTRV